jgi:parvulin-like peptidyl-prolyl isomerase
MFLAGAIAAASSVTQERVAVDRIAAVIENEIITMRELEAKAEPFMTKLSGLAGAEREARRIEILREVLDIEIDERIVNAEIERSREQLAVEEKDIDNAITEVLRMNNLTEDQLQAALYTQSITWSEYRKRLRTQIERTRLIQFRVQGKVQIKDRDVKRRCEERSQEGAKEVKVCASHILKQIPDGASADQIEALRAHMGELQAELASGGDFAAFALDHSDDKAAPDGDIGCFARGEMVEAFEKAAFALDVGGVSPVVRTPFGFHIIKVTERQRAGGGECDNSRVLAGIRDELYQEQMELQMSSWLRELRGKAFVDVRF